MPRVAGDYANGSSSRTSPPRWPMSRAHLSRRKGPAGSLSKDGLRAGRGVASVFGMVPPPGASPAPQVTLPLARSPMARTSAPSQLPSSREQIVEHRLRELAREGVLLRRVVAADQHVAADERLGAVAEARLGTRDLLPQPPQRSQRPLPGEGAQRDEDLCAFEQLQLLDQVWEAVVALRRRGAIARRRTAVDGGDIGAAQPQSVVATLRPRLVCEPGPVKRPIQPVPGPVAGEDAPGSVAAMGGGRQPDDDQPCGRVAEARERPRPSIGRLRSAGEAWRRPARADTTSRGQRRQRTIRRPRTGSELDRSSGSGRRLDGPRPAHPPLRSPRHGRQARRRVRARQVDGHRRRQLGRVRTRRRGDGLSTRSPGSPGSATRGAGW